MGWLKGRYNLAVAIGAVFGALTRFFITEAIIAALGKELGFYGTFLINVSGCFLIAYILTLTSENLRFISTELRLMLTTGFCGSYTTFSTYTLEGNYLLHSGNSAMMLIYLVGSAITGMVAVRFGVLLARLSHKSL